MRHAGGGGGGWGRASSFSAQCARPIARSPLAAQSLSEEQQEKEQKEGERESAWKGRNGRSSFPPFPPLSHARSATTDRSRPPLLPLPPFCFQVLFRGGKVK